MLRAETRQRGLHGRGPARAIPIAGAAGDDRGAVVFRDNVMSVTVSGVRFG